MKKKNSLPDLPNYFISKIYLQEYIYYDHSLVISVYSCIASFKKVIFKSKSLATRGFHTPATPTCKLLGNQCCGSCGSGHFFIMDPDPGISVGSGSFLLLRVGSGFMNHVEFVAICFFHQ